MNDLWMEAIGGAVAGGVAVILWAFLKKPKPCPDCGTPPPKFRKPANKRQALWGGWTCEKCGSELDRHGRKRTNGTCCDLPDRGDFLQ